MSNNYRLRILFWNIRHGGGERAGKIVEQIKLWNPDIVALAEFRGTAPSKSISRRLFDAGFMHQLTTVNSDHPTWNALFLASRYEVTHVDLHSTLPTDLYWLLAKVETRPALHIGIIHVPLDKYMPGFWLEYRKALLKIAGTWTLGPSLFVGDMNSAIGGLDDETEYSQGYKETFMNPIESLGWRDIFRAFHPTADAPTWVSRIGRGFRLDQAFVNNELQPHVASCQHDWGRTWNQKNLSDHAALLLDLKLPG